MANRLGNYDTSRSRDPVPFTPDPTPEQIAAEERARLAGQRRTQIIKIESPTGEQIHVAPADLANWRARGWRVAPEGD